MSPFAIAALVIVAVILIVAVVAYLMSGSDDEKNAAAADPLAGQPGHDHSNGADNCPACKAAANPVNVKVPEKCIVAFRPKAGWSGEFGFDWLREGDTTLTGDKDYATVVGNNKFTTLRSSHYETFTSPWKKDAANAPYVYTIPWLTLFPTSQCTGNTKKSEAKLTMYIEVVSKKPEVLRFDYDKTMIELDPAEIPADKYEIGKHQVDLTIKCKPNMEWDKDLELKVFPYKEGEDSIAGKLKIIKNNKANRFEAKVVFVNVS